MVTSLSKPVKSGSVVRMILTRVEEALINKELKPGDAFPSETELARMLGVGKSSIREAMKMLEAIGVVEIKQGEGTFIRKHPCTDSVNSLVFALLLEQGSSADITELRSMFEPAYTILAMHNATEDDIRKIERTIINLENNVKKGVQTVEDDMAFHISILESTHNPFVIRIGNTILELFKASMKESVQNIPQTAIDDHRLIFESFCRKNEEELHKAILHSFKGWIKNLEE